MSSGNSSIESQTPGSKLRAAREGARLTQEQLAKLVGISDGAISQWENDLQRPRAAHVAALVECLQIPPDLWPGVTPPPAGSADPRRDPMFFDFAASIAGHKWLRRAVIALADDEERQRFEDVLRRAEEIQ